MNYPLMPNILGATGLVRNKGGQNFFCLYLAIDKHCLLRDLWSTIPSGQKTHSISSGELFQNTWNCFNREAEIELKYEKKNTHTLDFLSVLSHQHVIGTENIAWHTPKTNDIETAGWAEVSGHLQKRIIPVFTKTRHCEIFLGQTQFA